MLLRDLGIDSSEPEEDNNPLPLELFDDSEYEVCTRARVGAAGG